MADQGAGAVDRRDSSDGNRRDPYSRQTNRLAVAVVEHNVLVRQVDVYLDEAAPPQRDPASREPAEQPRVRHKHLGVAGFGPVSVLQCPDPEWHLPVDGFPRLQDDARRQRVEARGRPAAGAVESPGPPGMEGGGELGAGVAQGEPGGQGVPRAVSAPAHRRPWTTQGCP